MQEVVKILDNDNLGNGIARIDNKVIFVKEALKDEEVVIKIIGEKRSYATAVISELKKESTARVKPSCPYYHRCGGCSFQHCTYEQELAIKENYVKRLFPKVTDKIVKTDIYNYRNKATLHVLNSKIGFYEKKSNTLVEIAKCLLLDERINMIIDLLKQIKLPDGSIMIRCSKTTREIMISTDFIFDYEPLKEKVASIYCNNKLMYGKPYIKEVLNGLVYTIYPASFFQVNTLGMIKLYDIIKSYANKADSLLDLYCGTGSIALYLSKNFKKISGLEIVKEAIANANLNKKLNNITNVSFKNADSKELKDSKYDVVSVDPPRSGLSKEVIKKLLALEPTRIIYTSCNPNTLKRDVVLLQDKYELQKVTPVNLFSRTEHVECVAKLVRKN